MEIITFYVIDDKHTNLDVFRFKANILKNRSPKYYDIIVM